MENKTPDPEAAIDIETMADDRKRAVRLRALGLSWAKIADRIGKDRRTVKKWVEEAVQ